MTSTDRDERLARVLDELIAVARNGGRPDLEHVAAEHPDLAAELRELWATVMVAEDLASHLDAPGEGISTSDGLARSGDNALQRFPLPAEVVGDYALLEELGRGGMGVVYKARQKSLNRTVALKMILRADLASSVDLARFQAEAEASARLSHPHIVPVYEVGSHCGHPYFSMKYIEGSTLARRLQDGPITGREAAAMLAPVARAVAEAHRHGILHRDLKPSNILIDQQGRPYVTDFGLAKQMGTLPEVSPSGPSDPVHLTETGAILGTPGYMAPEQAAGRRGGIGPATDVYSLGAVLYAMLTGRAPFQAATPVDTILQLLEQDPPPPRVLNSRVDPDLEMIALKCLQKPADLRYETAEELADDLERYLANEPISARSSHFSQVITRAFRETHHAVLLENWGLLWMWHSLALLVLCLSTNLFQWRGFDSRWMYALWWGFGLTLWAGCFWNLRRRAGPITFVERQIAHVWAGSVAASTLLFAVEGLLGLDVLQLSPVLGLISGMVFLSKAGILSGAFYVQAMLLFLTAGAMALLQRASRDYGVPDFGLSLFGVVSGLCFFVPGLKYFRQRQAARNQGDGEER